MIASCACGADLLLATAANWKSKRPMNPVQNSSSCRYVAILPLNVRAEIRGKRGLICGLHMDYGNRLNAIRVVSTVSRGLNEDKRRRWHVVGGESAVSWNRAIKNSCKDHLLSRELADAERITAARIIVKDYCDKMNAEMNYRIKMGAETDNYGKATKGFENTDLVACIFPSAELLESGALPV